MDGNFENIVMCQHVSSHDRNRKVIVTPHTAGIARQSFDALGPAVAENVQRLKKGEPLLNVAS
jgi:phosphoglycerate dehydrogenase-like enzyme